MNLFKILLKATLFTTLLCAGPASNAQVIPGDSAFMKIVQSDILLPMLIDSAIKYSGLVNRAGNNIALWKESENIDKKSILNSISLVSSYFYGTTGDLTIAKESGASSQFTNFRSSKSDRYNVGINLQLPLGTLLARKSVMRTSQLQAAMAADEKQNSILYVKQEVIRYYQEMKLSQKLLGTTSNGKEVAFLNYSMAEKQFLTAGLELEQLSRLHDIYTKAAIEYEMYLNRFQTSYLQLQTYTNTSLSALIAKVQ